MWSPWLREASLDVPATAQLHFGNAANALAAAVTHQGVMLARHSIVAAALASGQPICSIASMSPESAYAYHIAPPRLLRDTADGGAQWLLDEFASSARVTR